MPLQMPPSHTMQNTHPHHAEHPSHTMQNTHPHHAEHPSTSCRAPFHTMKNTHPRHAEHASTPSKCPLTTYASRGKACLQIRDMGSLSACKSPVGTR
ncbi:MAG: hypothetical protein J6M94_00110 [Prevotella sp.]|nr:hypothetical protein [Prevotella sp.]